jgi:hypothetical protein
MYRWSSALSAAKRSAPVAPMRLGLSRTFGAIAQRP